MSTASAQFEDLLHQEHMLADALHQQLELERDALAANDLQALQELQQHSAQAVENLRTHAAARLQWMQDHDLPISSECLNHPLVATAANIHRLWYDLEIQYHRNQTLSAALADVVLAARHRTQQKLKILRGQHNDPHLYNNKGTTSGLNHGQGFIQA